MPEMENKPIASFKFKSSCNGEQWITVRVVGNWIGFGMWGEKGEEGDLAFDINIAKQLATAISKAIDLASKDTYKTHVATIRVEEDDPDNCGEIKVLVWNQVNLIAVMDWTGTVDIILERDTAQALLKALNDAIIMASKYESIS